MGGFWRFDYIVMLRLPSGEEREHVIKTPDGMPNEDVWKEGERVAAEQNSTVVGIVKNVIVGDQLFRSINVYRPGTEPPLTYTGEETQHEAD